MDSKTFYGNNSSRKIVDEESSGSDYTPTDSEEHITDESSDADESDVDDSDADDIEVLSGEENLPSEGDSEAIEMQTAWKPVWKSLLLFPFTGKEKLCVQSDSGTEDGKPMPIDIFNLFISDDVVDHIVTETNRFALQRIEQ